MQAGGRQPEGGRPVRAHKIFDGEVVGPTALALVGEDELQRWRRSKNGQRWCRVREGHGVHEMLQDGAVGRVVDAHVAGDFESVVQLADSLQYFERSEPAVFGFGGLRDHVVRGVEEDL